jgi:hypothetical protein
MAKVPRHFDRLFEGADGVAEGVQLGFRKMCPADFTIRVCLKIGYIPNEIAI